MITIGVTQWTLDRTGVEAVFRASELGFSTVHLDGGEPGHELFVGTSRTQAAYRDACEAAGVTVSAIGLNVLDRYGLTSVPSSTE